MIYSETSLTQDEANVVGCPVSSMGQDANDTSLPGRLQVLKSVKIKFFCLVSSKISYLSKKLT